jgi:hypothetical protein
MKKQEIIQLAESMGFKLDYDKWNNPDKGEFSNGDWLRFVSNNDSLDEKNLRWIWFKDDNDETNIKIGKHIQSRLLKKKEIQEFLKY